VVTIFSILGVPSGRAIRYIFLYDFTSVTSHKKDAATIPNAIANKFKQTQFKIKFDKDYISEY